MKVPSLVLLHVVLAAAAESTPVAASKMRLRRSPARNDAEHHRIVREMTPSGRVLMVDMDMTGNHTEEEGHDMMLAPLECNRVPVDVATEACLASATPLSELVATASASASGSSPVVVPCGACVTVDYWNGETVEFPDGLEVLGRLHFPSDAGVEIRTTHVFVQGLLDMAKPDVGKKVKFYLHGSQDESLYPAKMCGGEGTGKDLDHMCEHKHEVGKKAFVVAGGQVIITAAPDCPSWTKLKSIESEPAPAVSPSCPSGGGALVVPDGTFESNQSRLGIWNLWGTATALVVATDEGEGNSYLSQMGRSSANMGLVLDASGGCVVPDRAYKLSFRYRIGTAGIPATGASAMVSTRATSTSGWAGHKHFGSTLLCDDDAGTNEGLTVTAGRWTSCEAVLSSGLTAEEAAHEVIYVRFRLGYDAGVDVDYDDLAFEPEAYDTGARTLRVDTAFASCVRPGEEILITSHDIGGWDKQTVRTVESVDASSGTIVITETVVSDIPTEAVGGLEANFAVEVARLNRDIVLEAEQDIVDPAVDLEVKHGGHFMVLHTPGVSQVISGLEINGFGQHGILGRYPIHFHMSKQVGHETIVFRNVVRDSNQRCIVVHGSHGVQITDNVAFNTFGHCYILEDGAETGNTFDRNLGAMTKMHRVDLSKGLTVANDHEEVSTFWVTNPQNDYIGNVAAGSEMQGFWFDTKDDVQGPSSMLAENADVHPFYTPLGSFVDNRAHSNGENGVALYPKGWEPSEVSIFESIVAYKNRRAGVLIHGNLNVIVRDAIMADNNFCARYFFNPPGSNLLTNSTCIGKSQDVRNRDGNACHPKNEWLSIEGVRFAYNELEGGAMVLANVHFQGFDDIGPCQTGEWAAQALYAHGFPNHAVLGSHTSMDVTPRMTGLTFESVTNRFDIPPVLADTGVENIYVEDIDGTIGPDGRGPGFFVQDNTDMKAFLPPCVPLPPNPSNAWTSRAVFCEHVCLRKLLIKAHGDARTIVVEEVGGIGLTHSFGKNDVTRRFDPVLPAGSYRIAFLDADGTPFRPPSMVMTLGEAPQCEDHITEESIDWIEMECSVDGGIVAGDGSFQTGSLYGFYGSWEGGPVSVVVSEDGVGHFLSQEGRGTTTRGGLGVKLDQSCAEPRTYVLSFKYRSHSDVDDVASAQVRWYVSGSLEATLITCPDPSPGGSLEWVECSLTFEVTAEMVSADKFEIYLHFREHNTGRADYDDIRVEPGCRANGDIVAGDGSGEEQSKYGFFSAWQGGPISMSSENGNGYFAQDGRAISAGGMGVTLETSCTLAGMYGLSVKFRSHSESDDVLGAQFRWYIGSALQPAVLLMCPDPSPGGSLEWIDCYLSVEVTAQMLSATKFEIYLTWRSGNIASADYDEISFKPHISRL